MSMQLQAAARGVKGRPVNESVGLDRDPVWLNINFPKARPEGDWRRDLCREAAATRDARRRTLQLNDLSNMKGTLRRHSTDPQVRRALRQIKRRVSDIDSQRSSQRSSAAASAEPQLAAAAAGSSGPAAVAEPALETWRRYTSEEGMTERIQARADEILRKPPNASKEDNRLFLGSRVTGPSDYRANMKHGADYLADGHIEYLKLANLAPDTARIRWMAGADDRRASRLSVGEGRHSVLGLYRNFEVPNEAPPDLSPRWPTDANVSNNDASYVLHEGMMQGPSSEQLFLTHADVHTGVNRTLPRRHVMENKCTPPLARFRRCLSGLGSMVSVAADTRYCDRGTSHIASGASPAPM